MNLTLVLCIIHNSEPQQQQQKIYFLFLMNLIKDVNDIHIRSNN